MKAVKVYPGVQKKTLGDIIKELRMQQDISQDELCQRVEITQTYLSLIENSKKEPSLDVLKKIAKELNTPYQVLYFFTLNEENIPEEKKEIYKTLAPMFNKLIRTTFIET